MTRTQTTRGAAGLLSESLLFLVHSNIFISLAATSVAISTIVLADLPIEALPLFMVFAVTMFVYSFNRITDIAEDRQNLPDRVSFVERYGKPFLLFGTVLYGLATVIALVENVPGAPGMVLPLLIALLYSVAGLKRVLLVKNLLVGIAWGLIPLGVGVYYGQLFTTDILFLFLYITVVLTIAAIVFDIKDIEGDRAEGIRTIPVLLGPQSTRRISAVLTVLIAGGLAGLLASGNLPVSYTFLLVYNVYIFGYSLFATENRTSLFYGFVIDGEHLLVAALLLGYEYLLPTLWW